MEVSDPNGKTWDGTEIQETVKQVKNSCGARARRVCSNESAEDNPGGGSNFTVGAASNFLGMAPLAKATNSFYDVHAFVLKGVSITHEKGIKSCEIQCEQTYSCAGKQLGPTFAITYGLTMDEAHSNDVTRVGIKKAAKAAPPAIKPSTQPASPPSGAKP